MPVRLSSRLIAFITILASAVFLSGCGINTIPTYEQDAKAKWSEVQNQYKRRADLIPNLVESVRGFADQEKSVLTGVTEARAKATQVQVTLPPDILTNPEAMKKFARCARPAVGRARQAAGRVGALSRYQVGRELHGLAEPDRGDRKPHRDRAARLHRGRAAV